MNEKIKELEDKAHKRMSLGGYKANRFNKIFAELIIRECKDNIETVWYNQGLDIRGAELGKFMTMFDEQNGVK
jgi:hypothetical protein